MHASCQHQMRQAYDGTAFSRYACYTLYGMRPFFGHLNQDSPEDHERGEPDRHGEEDANHDGQQFRQGVGQRVGDGLGQVVEQHAALLCGPKYVQVVTDCQLSHARVRCLPADKTLPCYWFLTDTIDDRAEVVVHEDHVCQAEGHS